MSTYAEKYATVTEITPKTVPWTDFYEDTRTGADADPFTYQDACDRCGGQGGSEAWKHTGWKCYKCGGQNSVWTVKTTVGEMRRRDRKAAQALAGAVRRELKDAREAAAALDAQRAAYPALAWFSWDGFRELEEAGAIRGNAAYILPEMLGQDRGLSQKQAAFAAKLLQEALDRRQIDEAKAAGWSSGIAAPEGKHEVEGTVQWIKDEEDTFSPYGGTVWKMSVKTDAGWSVITSVPAKLEDAAGGREALRGRRVRFTVGLKPARRNPEIAYSKGQKSKVALLDA